MRLQTAVVALAIATAAMSGCASFNRTAGRTLAASQAVLAHAEMQAHTAYVTGLISKPTIQRIASLADKVDAVSLTARCAYASGDIGTVAGALSELGIIAAAITAETSGKPVPNVPAFASLTCTTPAPVAVVAAP